MWWTLPPFLASNIVVGTLFAPENSLFTQSWNKTNIPEFVLLPSNIVNIQILSLHFFSKTMKCPFNWILNLPLLTLPSMNLSFLHFLTTCLTFLSRGNTFHRPTWGAVKDSLLSKRLFVPHPTPSSHQERGLHPATYCPFHLIVKVFFSTQLCHRSFLKKKKRRTVGTTLCHRSLLFHTKWRSPSPNSRSIADSASRSPRRSLR